MQTKICSHCNVSKDVSEFPKDKSRKDGFFSWCKDCFNKDKKEKYPERKEKIL